MRTESAVTVIELKGQFDSRGAEEFNGFCQAHDVMTLHHVIIDFAKVNLITSHALCVLLVLLKKLRAVKGDLVFCHVPPQIRDVLRMAGFVNFIKMFPTLEEAVKVAA